MKTISGKNDFGNKGSKSFVSIKTKILRGVILPTFLVLLSYETVVLILEVRKSRADFLEEQAVWLEDAADRIALHVWDFDYKNLGNVLNMVLKTSSTRKITVKDMEKNILMTVTSGKKTDVDINSPLYALFGYPVLYVSERPVAYFGNVLGYMEVERVFTDLQDKWNEMTRRFIMEILTFIILSFVTVALIFSRTVSAPLKKIIDSLENLKNRDFSLPITGESNDELGYVSVLVNSMAEELHKSYDTLKEQNRTLGQQVKERTSELESSANSTRMILDNLPEAIFIHDFSGKILEINKKMLSMYEELARGNVIGANPMDFSSNDMNRDRIERHWQRAALGESQVFEWKAKSRTSGRVFDVEVNLNKIAYNGKEVILATVSDISGRKQMDAFLKAKTEELEKFNHFMIGRESRMSELKQEINRLSDALGKARPYQGREDG